MASTRYMLHFTAHEDGEGASLDFGTNMLTASLMAAELVDNGAVYVHLVKEVNYQDRSRVAQITLFHKDKPV